MTTLRHFFAKDAFPTLRPFFLYSVLILLFACGKDDNKKPTRVTVRFEVQKDEIKKGADNGGGQGNSPQLSLAFTSGKMYFKSIRLIGERENGKDVDFLREEQLQVPIEEGVTDEKTYFELPQGSYASLKMELRYGRKGGGKVLECKGERKIDPHNSPLEATPFRLKVQEERIVKLSVLKGPNLELKKGDPQNIQLKVEVGKWFQSVGIGQWQGATVGKGPQNKDRIIINKGKNPTLYEKVLEQIENGFKAKIL